MKRMISLGLLALGLTLAHQQPASAWCNFKFGAGVNWHWQSGNNSYFCGLFKSGEVPGPEYFGVPGCGAGCAVPGGYGGAPLSGYTQDQFQYYGANPGVPGQPAYAGAPQQPTPHAPQAANVAQQTGATMIPNYQQPQQYQTPYQPASYNPYYYGNNYYQPAYGQYFYAPPSYYQWGVNYGR